MSSMNRYTLLAAVLTACIAIGNAKAKANPQPQSWSPRFPGGSHIYTNSWNRNHLNPYGDPRPYYNNAFGGPGFGLNDFRLGSQFPAVPHPGLGFHGNSWNGLRSGHSGLRQPYSRYPTGLDRYGSLGNNALPRHAGNWNRYGTNRGRYGANWNQRFGQNWNRFPVGRYAGNWDRFGSSRGRYGPSWNRAGTNLGRYAGNWNRFGINSGRYGSGWNSRRGHGGRYGGHWNGFGANKHQSHWNNYGANYGYNSPRYGGRGSQFGSRFSGHGSRRPGGSYIRRSY